jgi:hypothetical protein
MPCRHGQLHRLLLWKWWSMAAAFDQRGLLGDMAALEIIAVSTRGTSRGNGVDAMCRPSVAWGSVSKQDCVACEAENCAVLRTPLSSANAPSLKALFLLVWMKAMVKVVCKLLVCDVGVSQHPDPTSVFETLLRTGVRNPDFTEEKSGVRPLLPGPSPTVSRPVDRCPVLVPGPDCNPTVSTGSDCGAWRGTPGEMAKQKVQTPSPDRGRLTHLSRDLFPILLYNSQCVGSKSV